VQVSSFCDLALALTCSARHRGASESEALHFNASTLAHEIERLLPLCPNPCCLEPLLLLMSAVQLSTGEDRRKGLSVSVDCESGSGRHTRSVFAAELSYIFKALSLHPDAARTSLWRDRCQLLLNSEPLCIAQGGGGNNGSESRGRGLGVSAFGVGLSSGVGESMLMSLDRVISKMSDTNAARSHPISSDARGGGWGEESASTHRDTSAALEMVALVQRCYHERTRQRWLWARVVGRFLVWRCVDVAGAECTMRLCLSVACKGNAYSGKDVGLVVIGGGGSDSQAKITAALEALMEVVIVCVCVCVCVCVRLCLVVSVRVHVCVGVCVGRRETERERERERQRERESVCVRVCGCV